MTKFTTRIPLKVTIGYLLLLLMLGLTIVLVNGHTQALTRISRAEDAYTHRRNVVDSMVYAFMQANNDERAIYLGADLLDDYERHIGLTLRLTDSLKRMYADSDKIDTLRILLRRKYLNTQSIMATISRLETDTFLTRKVDDLRRGADTLVVASAQGPQKSETVYEVVRTRKSFLGRLADVFRRQRTDTVSVKHSSMGDTVHTAVDIAPHLAGALEEVHRHEARARRSRQQALERQAARQQMVGARMVERIVLLLEEIRTDEHRKLQAALSADLSARRATVMRIVLLAILSLIGSGWLLYQAWRDSIRERRYRESLIQAKAATERLTLTITHDVKAPAASIAGFAGLMEEYIEPQNRDTLNWRKLRGYVSGIKDSATHLLDMVQTLLELHRLEQNMVEAKPVVFNLYEVVESCTLRMQPQAGSKQLNLTHQVQIADGCTPYCQADVFRIRRILDNLLSNAIKYTDTGSVSVMARRFPGEVEFEVRDTGRGMTPAESERVFEAFMRLEGTRDIEGVGLGLSITRESVRLLGGTITLQSAPGQGSTFRVRIPVSDAAPADKAEPEVEVGLPVAASEAATEDILRILIVDDDRLQLQLLSELIKSEALKAGRQVDLIACNSAHEAIDCYHRIRPHYCFIDQEMPEMSGRRLLSRLLSEAPSQMIATTAHDPQILPALLASGFQDCLFKPVKRTDLNRILGFVVPDVPTPESTSPFAPLIEFADGDRGAIREIFGGLHADVSHYMTTLKEAKSSGHYAPVAHAAHKALPVMELIGFNRLAELRLLTHENIGNLTDQEISNYLDLLIVEFAQLLDLIQKELEATGN